MVSLPPTPSSSPIPSPSPSLSPISILPPLPVFHNTLPSFFLFLIQSSPTVSLSLYLSDSLSSSPTVSLSLLLTLSLCLAHSLALLLPLSLSLSLSPSLSLSFLVLSVSLTLSVSNCPLLCYNGPVSLCSSIMSGWSQGRDSDSEGLCVSQTWQSLMDRGEGFCLKRGRADLSACYLAFHSCHHVGIMYAKQMTISECTISVMSIDFFLFSFFKHTQK